MPTNKYTWPKYRGITICLAYPYSSVGFIKSWLGHIRCSSGMIQFPLGMCVGSSRLLAKNIFLLVWVLIIRWKQHCKTHDDLKCNNSRFVHPLHSRIHSVIFKPRIDVTELVRLSQSWCTDLSQPILSIRK